MPFKKAERERTPLLIGLYGQTGSGKTFSGLRLASGIARQLGKPIAFIDTEAGRALHYADRFVFDVQQLAPPYEATRYLELVREAAAAGYGVVVIDSMTHEHTGQGGLLEQHALESERIAKEWRVPVSAAGFPAWQKPKRVRQQLLTELARTGVDVILCFRAKERVRMPTREERSGGQREPIQIGLCPVGGEEYAYECTLFAGIGRLGKGVPDWAPTGERAEDLTKLPEQLASVFRVGEQLTEEHGYALSVWACGGALPERHAEQPAASQPHRGKARTELPPEPPEPDVPANDEEMNRLRETSANASSLTAVRELVFTFQRSTVLTHAQRAELKDLLRLRADELRAS